MICKEYYINDDGIKLHIKLDRNEKMEPCPLVIVIHGFTGDMEENHILAACNAMHEAGYATLRAEMYGHGLSDGEFVNHNLYKWINNGLAVIDHAKSLDFVSDLYLCGHSQGGLLTILLAGMRCDDFKAIIPLAPALNIPDLARKGDLFAGSFDPDHIPDIVDLHDLVINGDYLRVAQMIYAEDSIKRYKGPVLLIHGDQDLSVPIHYSYDAVDKFENATLKVIAGDTHCYDYHVDMMAQYVYEFLVDLK